MSVHTPEYEREKNRDTVVRATKRFGIDHPVYMDNDFGYWQDLDNRYWPAFYLVDRSGRVRLRAVGEMHRNTSRAAEFETTLETLLAESPRAAS